MKCTKCGAELLENSKFCMSCGAAAEQPAVPQQTETAAEMPAAEMSVVCPSCSSVMPAGANVCGICGQMLAAPEQEPVTTRLPAEPAPHFQPVDRAALMQCALPEDGAPAAAAAKPKAASTRRNVIILVIVLLIVIVGAVFAVLAMGSGESGSAVGQLTLAQRYLDEQNYEQAVIEFERLLEIDPKNVDAYLGLSQAYKALGEYDKAAMALEQAKENVDEADKERIEAAIAELGAVDGETNISDGNVTDEAGLSPDIEGATEEAEHAESTETSCENIVELMSSKTVSADGEVLKECYVSDEGRYVVISEKSHVEYEMLDDGSKGRIVYREHFTVSEYKQVCANLYMWLDYGIYSYEWSADGVLLSSEKSGTNYINSYTYEFILDDNDLVAEMIVRKADGDVFEHCFYSYTADGEFAEILKEGVDDTYLEQYVYDDDGRLIQEVVSKLLDDGNYVVEDVITYRYHSNGELAEEQFVSDYSNVLIEDGIAVFSSETHFETIVRTYENGMPAYDYTISQEHYTESDGYVLDSEYYDEYYYDEWGNMISEKQYTYDYDSSVGETYEQICCTTYENRYTFGEDGLPVSFETWYTGYTVTENGVVIENNDEPYLVSVTECEYKILN